MFANLIKITLRNLWRNRMSTVINLAGLSLAVSVGIVSFLFVDNFLHYDEFHENKDRTYLVESIIAPDGTPQHWGVSPTALGPTLVRDLPQVEAEVRIRRRGLVVRQGANVFNEDAFFAGPDFFNIFTFPLIKGNPESFRDPSSVIITEEYAEKYFGEEDPIGQTLTFIVNEQPHDLLVEGVLGRKPVNSSLFFNILIPIANVESWYDFDLNSWDGWVTGTFIMLEEGADIASVGTQLQPYIEQQNDVNPAWAVQSFVLDCWNGAAMNGWKQRSTVHDNMPSGYIVIMGAIGFILLLLASFNYANNALVVSTRRFREIGIRKIVGSTRHQLVSQFLGESIIMMLFALITGFALAKWVLLPAWETVFNGTFVLDVFKHYRTAIFLVALLFVTGIGSGLYPALIVSNFKPVDIFKGPSHKGGYTFITRFLTGLQIAFTFIVVFFSVYNQMNHKYQQTLDWGYDPTGIVSIKVEEASALEAMLQELRNDPDAVNVLSTNSHFGYNDEYYAFVAGEQRHDVSGMEVPPGYMEMMSVRQVRGRSLGLIEGEVDASDVVINEILAADLGWDEPIGRTVEIDGDPFTIIGIAEDLNLDNLEEVRPPMVYRLSQQEEHQFIVVKTQRGKEHDIAKKLEGLKAELLPEFPHVALYQDEVFNRFFEMYRRISTVLNFCGAMALIISMMGLFGLISAQLSKREREIGIRKVLGANVRQVIQLMTMPFVRLFLIAVALAAAPAIYLTKMYAKSNFAEFLDFSPTIVAATMGFMLIVIVAILLSQILSRANANPAQVLRDE